MFRYQFKRFAMLKLTLVQSLHQRIQIVANSQVSYESREVRGSAEEVVQKCDDDPDRRSGERTASLL